MKTNDADRQKKIAVLGDLTGYGRCALTVSIPLLSAHRIQVCPVPTAILSNHTGFSSFFMEDYTEKLPSFFAEWEKLSLSFDGIMTGFLGSEKQVDLVIDFIHRFKTPDTLLVVDPVMGDNGSAYQTFTKAHCNEMKKLASLADILTPNLTEACLLTDTPYQEQISRRELTSLADTLIPRPNQKIVITGLLLGDRIGSFYAMRKEDGTLLTGMFSNKKIAGLRCGTGDVFASLITADALFQKAFPLSVKSAGRFVCKCLAASAQKNIPPENGVCFEDFMYLKR